MNESYEAKLIEFNQYINLKWLAEILFIPELQDRYCLNNNCIIGNTKLQLLQYDIVEKG